MTRPPRMPPMTSPLPPPPPQPALAAPARDPADATSRCRAARAAGPRSRGATGAPSRSPARAVLVDGGPSPRRAEERSRSIRMRSASARRVRASAPIQPRWPAMTSRATASCRSASSIAWRTCSSGGIGRAARSRAAAIAASSPAFASRSRDSCGERVGVDAGGGQRGERGLERGDRGRHGGTAAPVRATTRSSRESSTIAGERRLGAQRLDLEVLDRVEERRRATHRLGRGLEREIGLLALPASRRRSATPALCSANPSSCSASAALASTWRSAARPSSGRRAARACLAGVGEAGAQRAASARTAR